MPDDRTVSGHVGHVLSWKATTAPTSQSLCCANAPSSGRNRGSSVDLSPPSSPPAPHESVAMRERRSTVMPAASFMLRVCGVTDGRIYQARGGDRRVGSIEEEGSLDLSSITDQPPHPYMTEAWIRSCPPFPLSWTSSPFAHPVRSRPYHDLTSLTIRNGMYSDASVKQ